METKGADRRARRVKPRHAAALALVGWYPMIPPSTGSEINIKAPIREWQQAGAYDTAAECEQDKNVAANAFLKGSKENENSRKENSIDPKVAYFNAMLYASGICVETDDPRLKEK
jgi:hypothetical protein